jgi:hypothetical protein
LIVHVDGSDDAPELSHLPVSIDAMPESNFDVSGARSICSQYTLSKHGREMPEGREVLSWISHRNCLPVDYAGQCAARRIDKQIALPEVAMAKDRLIALNLRIIEEAVPPSLRDRLLRRGQKVTQ